MVKRLTNSWNKISSWGTDNVEDPLELHSVKLSNRFSIAAIPIVLIISFVLGLQQWNLEPIFVSSFTLIFLTVILLNQNGYYRLSRTLLSISLPTLILGVSIISKTIPDELVTNSEYFDYRYVLIATSIVPPVLFSSKQSYRLIVALIPYFIGLVFFDDFHEFFGVGYYQIFHENDSYPVTTIISTLMFIIIAIAMFILRASNDRNQLMNIQLIEDLTEAKGDLEEKAEELRMKNEELNSRVRYADIELENTNKELIRQNNELQQFSYTVSHNLRGPIARIQGLSNLIENCDESEKWEYIELIKRTARLLDSNLKDLSSIIDLRKDVYKIKQRINIEDLLNDLKLHFEEEIREYDVKIISTIEVKEVVCVRAMLVSVLYNLFSNAIKYRRPNVSPVIKFDVQQEGDMLKFSVRDNGIGIDLDNYKNELFKLYKRFNTQTEGKGIGLYLVLKQIEVLGGKIEVDSSLGEFTQFDVLLPYLASVEFQEIHREEGASVAYNMDKHYLFLDWKERHDSFKGFQKSMNQIYDSFKELKVYHWIVDNRNRAELDQNEQIWILQDFYPKAFKQGLKRLAIIQHQELDTATISVLKQAERVFDKYDIKVHFAKNTEEAEEWLVNNPFDDALRSSIEEILRGSNILPN